MSNRPKLLRPAYSGTKVRNVATGRVLPCNWADCEADGNVRIHISVPHEAPRFPGEQLVYIFCSDTHRRFFAQGTPYEQYL